MPVLIACVQAIAHPRFNLDAVQTSTHNTSALPVVNGPMRKALDLNWGYNHIGSRWHSTATIGRALRLIMANVGGTPGSVNIHTQGHIARFEHCIAENEEENPWEPLHVERGFGKDQSVVTVVNTEAPHSMTENIQTDPNEIVRTFASCMGTLGVNNLYSQGNPVLVLGIEHAQHIAVAGWTKQDLQRALFERARQPWGLVKNRGKSKGPRFPVWVDRNDDSSTVPIVWEPRDLLVVVAGGAGGKSMFLPTAGGQSLAVSKAIETK
jgi:hypothetical protein